jgi:bidirectional [NiFe] hydrogenase diaphorase subunit
VRGDDLLNLIIDGVKVQAEEDSTILEVARFYGIDIPALCHHDELTSYGACRLCTVEVEEKGKKRLVASCLYPAKEGLRVRTHTARVINGRKMILELLLARCPSSKVLQDMASKMGLQKMRFKPENDDCILCGLCVRMCAEQMRSGALGFVGRGDTRKVVTPFHERSEVCRSCGACMYICPAMELQCRGKVPSGDLCNSCLVISPQCLEKYDEVMCHMEACGGCVTKENVAKGGK